MKFGTSTQTYETFMYLKCVKAKTNTILNIVEILQNKVNGSLLYKHHLIIPSDQPLQVAILADDLEVLL